MFQARRCAWRAKVPESLSQAAALLFGITETVAGVWISCRAFALGAPCSRLYC